MRGIHQARTNWTWVGVFNIWYFRQVGDISSERADYYFRLVDIDFTPRLVYQRLKEAATVTVVAQPGFYQETNAAVELRGNWQPYLSGRSSLGREMVTRAPGARAVIRFWGDGVELLMRRGPTEGRAWITVDGNRVPGFPLDSNNNSYIDLASPNDEYQVRISTGNLVRGAHMVELVVGQSGEVALDGFEVFLDSTREFPWALAVGFGILLVGSSGLFVFSLIRSRRKSSEEPSHGA